MFSKKLFLPWITVLSFVDEAKIRSIIYVMGLQSNETNSIMAAATIRLKIQVKNVCQSDSRIFQKKLSKGAIFSRLIQSCVNYFSFSTKTASHWSDLFFLSMHLQNSDLQTIFPIPTSRQKLESKWTVSFK